MGKFVLYVYNLVELCVLVISKKNQFLFYLLLFGNIHLLRLWQSLVIEHLVMYFRYVLVRLECQYMTYIA